jgi:hypothetical protein
VSNNNNNNNNNKNNIVVSVILSIAVASFTIIFLSTFPIEGFGSITHHFYNYLFF